MIRLAQIKPVLKALGWRAILIGPTAFAVPMVASYLYARFTVDSRIERQRVVNEELTIAIAEVNSRVTSVLVREETMFGLLTRLDLVQTINRMNFRKAYLLAGMSRLPQSVSVTKVEIDGSAIRMEGVARDVAGIVGAVENLADIDGINEPRIESYQLRQSGLYEFSLRAD